MTEESKEEKKEERKPKRSSPPPAPKDHSGTIVSRLNFPVTLSYEGKGMMLPARGRIYVKDRRLLGAYPKGVNLI